MPFFCLIQYFHDRFEPITRPNVNHPKQLLSDCGNFYTFSDIWVPQESRMNPAGSLCPTLNPLCIHYILCACSAGASGGGGRGLPPTRKIAPLGKAVARVFPNVSLAMCPPKTLFGPLLARHWRRYCMPVTVVVFAIEL